VPFPKVTKRLRTKATKAQTDAAVDRKESAFVRKRSGGLCEVRTVALTHTSGLVITMRCGAAAVHVMHLIGGRGKRGRGISCLREHKLHGCLQHHRDIDGDLGGKKLKRLGGPVPRWDDVYERVR